MALPILPKELDMNGSSSRTILTVEGEPTLVSTLRYSLERAGNRAVSADGGEQGLAAARAERGIGADWGGVEEPARSNARSNDMAAIHDH